MERLVTGRTNIETELAKHRHLVAANDTSSAVAPLSTNQLAQGGHWGGGSNDYDLAGTATAANILRSGQTGTDVAHNTMPPYRGIYVIKRTARLYYVV